MNNNEIEKRFEKYDRFMTKSKELAGSEPNKPSEPEQKPSPADPLIIAARIVDTLNACVDTEGLDLCLGTVGEDEYYHVFMIESYELSNTLLTVSFICSEKIKLARNKGVEIFTLDKNDKEERIFLIEKKVERVVTEINFKVLHSDLEPVIIPLDVENFCRRNDTLTISLDYMNMFRE